jgi:hypothetical protein
MFLSLFHQIVLVGAGNRFAAGAIQMRLRHVITISYV